MTEANFSYLLFELAGLVAALLVLTSLGITKTLLTKRFMMVLAALYGLWICWDLFAVHLGVFHFPETGSLPFRLVGLPIEEHLFYGFHVIVIWAVVEIAETSKPMLSSGDGDE